MKIHASPRLHHCSSRSVSRRFPLSRICIAVGAASLQLSAYAQQQPGATANDTVSGEPIKEVVITAEKRGSTVRKTPISITAVSGDDLMEKGVTSATKLAQETVGVAVRSGGPGQTEYSMRGLSSSVGVSPTVGFYLDEVPVSPPSLASSGKSGIDPDLYDLARVEILRGPQGTLYGAGSMGGTIKLIPNAPKLDKFEGSYQVRGSSTQGGGANGTLNAMLNIPLSTGESALRVVASKKHNSGWIDRIVVDPFPLPNIAATSDYFSAPRGNVAAAPVTKRYSKANSEDTEMARVVLLFQPVRELKVEPSVLYQQIKLKAQPIIDVDPGTNAHYQPFDVAEPFLDRFTVASVKVSYDAPSWSLMSATSYSTRTRRQTQDGSEIMQKALGDMLSVNAYQPAAGGIGKVVSYETNPLSQFTQEVRITSSAPGPWKWIAGAFYSSLKSTYDAHNDAFDAQPVLGTTELWTTSIKDHLVQTAVFGNVSYDVTPSLKGTVGLRYFTSKDTSTNGDSGFFASGVAEKTSTKADGFNPAFNLAYTLDSDTLMYATAGKGFRDGAAQYGVPADLCASDLAALGLKASPRRYGPDTVWNYELGMKSRFLNGRFGVNAAVYEQKWNNMQAGVALPSCGFLYTDNVASAESKGIEIEATARLARGLILEQNIGYTHARTTSAAPQASIKVGDKLNYVPEWTANTSLRYSTPIDDERNFLARLNVAYIGKQNALAVSPITLPSYTTIDARAGVQTDSWSLFLYADNLADRRSVITVPQSSTINTPGLTRNAVTRPRTIGIDFSHSF